jgi:RNA exonuclease 1
MFPQKWTCCGKSTFAPTSDACQAREFHVPIEYSPGSLEKVWEFHQTPPKFSTSSHVAVAIDCEMGLSATGESKVIRISLIDYFTAEILIDTLVWPEEVITNLQTKWSGVTWNQMYTARNSGRIIWGTSAAREAIWRFVGPETVVSPHC